MEDIQRDLGRLEAKVDILLQRSEAAEARDTSLSSRVTTLEGDVARAKGVTAFISAAVATAATLFSGLIGKS